MFRSASNFDKYLEKATSLNNIEPDWSSIMALCDCLRSNEVSGKNAMEAIKKKMQATNPNIVLLTLDVLESCVKNCGPNFNAELATHTFMNDYSQVLRQAKDHKVREKMLDLMSNWAYAFRNQPAYHPVSDKMKLLKLEGYKFPAQKETTDALFTAVTAPQWAEGPCCHRCRTEFSLVQRKHHCRACGQVFCAKCSSKTTAIPAYGFEKEVRVCDFCYQKINKKPDTRRREKSSSSGSKSLKKSLSNVSATNVPASAQPGAPRQKTEEEIREEEELQLALALSLSENENKHRSHSLDLPAANAAPAAAQPKRSKSKNRTGRSKSRTRDENREPKVKSEVPEENIDPEMQRYLNRDYWINRTQQSDMRFSPSPSAPAPSISSGQNYPPVKMTAIKDVRYAETQNGVEKKMIGTIDAEELNEFKTQLRSSLDVFINRLNLNKLRGRAITNDHGVQSMFMNITNMHSRLVHYIQETNNARSNCERLQDKVAQIRDARAALDALRDEHRDELRQQQEEAERLKQVQMAQKLEIMRRKKQEYLQYQREIAIQRMQEQERELMMMRTGQQQSQQNWQMPAQSQPQQFYNPQMAYQTGPVMSQAPGASMGVPGQLPVSTTIGQQQPSAAPIPCAVSSQVPSSIAPPMTGVPVGQPPSQQYPGQYPVPGYSNMAPHPGMGPPPMYTPQNVPMYGPVPMQQPQQYPPGGFVPQQGYIPQQSPMQHHQQQQQYQQPMGGGYGQQQLPPPQQQQLPPQPVVEEQPLINFD